MGKNIGGLLEHSAALKCETEAKVNQAIEALGYSRSRKVTFKAISELSGVSTTTLYNNPVLRERISSLRDNIPSFQPVVSNKVARDREQEMRQEIQKLMGDKEMLIQQLVELEALKAENKKLKALLSQRKRE